MRTLVSIFIGFRIKVATLGSKVRTLMPNRLKSANPCDENAPTPSGHSISPLKLPLGRPTKREPCVKTLTGKNLEKTMQKKESKNGGTEPENQGPEPQSARAGAIETHFRIFWKNSNNHKKCIHFSSLFRFFFAPFSKLFGKNRKRGPGSSPRAIKISQNGPQGRQNGAQESTIYVPRSHHVQTPAAGCSPKAT